MMWNYTGGGLFALAWLAAAFAITLFIRTLFFKDASMRLASKRSGIFAIFCAILAFLIMNTLAEQRPTEKDIQAASEFVQDLEKQK